MLNIARPLGAALLASLTFSLLGCQSSQKAQAAGADQPRGFWQKLMRAPERITIPSGTRFEVRLADTLSSNGNRSGDTFAATLDEPIVVNDQVLVPTGAKVTGQVTAATASGHLKTPAELALTLTSLEVGGKTERVEAEKVLMAAGRALNTEDLGLAEAGVQLTDRGFVKVNLATLETTAPGVYCIGDVAGPPMLAHKGYREGEHVAELLAGHPPRPIDYTNVPNVTYCHPEVASVGLTEEQAKAKGLAIQVGRFPFSANGRARTSNETEGLVKIIRDTKYGEIVGAHIVGSHASEIIHELVVARTNEYTVEEVDLAIHAHPTLSEAIAEAALDSMGRVLHI